ncbi:MAG: glycosyl transferase, WecB/TagA/CpsF family, partial [Streptomyces oryziradicis]|nr:glycosyl transferase, WecB/TagA/CpsF family [Actinacidiphila oryziradicis]
MTILAGTASGHREVPVVGCLGVPIASHTRESAARQVIQLARQHRDARPAAPARGSDVHLCNAHTLSLADRDPELHGILRGAALNLPDGQPVVWANQLLHRNTPLPT